MGRKLTSVAAMLEFQGSPIHVSSESEIRVLCDFNALMTDSEYLRAATVTVREMPTGRDVSSSIAVPPTYWSSKVLVALSGFTAGKVYRVEVLADVWAVIDPNKIHGNYFTIRCASEV